MEDFSFSLFEYVFGYRFIYLSFTLGFEGVFVLILVLCALYELFGLGHQSMAREPVAMYCILASTYPMEDGRFEKTSYMKGQCNMRYTRMMVS